MDNDIKSNSKIQTTNGYGLPKQIIVLYSDVKREYFPTEEAYLSEKGAVKYAEVISSYIEKLGVKTILLPGNSSLIRALKKTKADMVLNLVDTLKGSDYQASIIPAVLEFLEIPYVGTSALGLSLSSNKYLISKLLQTNGVPVAYSQLFRSPSDFLDPTIRFPLISKLNETHGSIEITKESVSENEKHLRERLKFLFSRYKEPVLVEEFIVGREITAVLLEGLNKKVYMGERVFTNSTDKYQILTFELKWLYEKQGISYQIYEDPILKEYVKKAFAVTQMYDYARFDVRIDSSGRYYFLDSNPNPFLEPVEAGGSVGIVLDLHGIPLEEIIKRLLINTVRDTLGKERVSYPQVI